MADAKLCDKCNQVIAGKVYGGEDARQFSSTVDANGLGRLTVQLYVYRGTEDPDLCGGCFREIVMKAVRDPEPTHYAAEK